MNSNCVGSNRASFNYSGQGGYGMRIPGHLNSHDQSQINLFDGVCCNLDKCSIYRPFYDLRYDYINYFRDEHTDFERMELSDIDELLMLEQIMFEQQEHRLRHIKQLKQDLYSEDDPTFIQKLMLKQQRLSLSLNNYEDALDSTYMNQKPKRESILISRNGDKDCWGENLSVEQYSKKASSIKSQTQSDSGKTSQPQESLQKSRHCRHFLKGHCERGESCGFRHDQSLFCSNLQKVFLGGLPSHLTSTLLRKKLTELGYTVLNNPKMMRWFSPQVCLGSAEEAQRLVEKGTIVIDNTVVQVRPFEAFSCDSKKKPADEVERSVFLGGLTPDTTAKIIQDELRVMGLVVVNTPVLKSGFSPQVVLETFDQAQKLIKLKKVQINGTLVNVRPYANIRSSSKKRRGFKLKAVQTK